MTTRGAPDRSTTHPGISRYAPVRRPDESLSGRVFGALLLAGWATYISVVVASNLSDLASSFGWEHWAFRSGNLDYIAKATAIYGHSRTVDQVLLGAVIVWETLAALLLWRAAVAWLRTGAAHAQARSAYATLAMLWFAFGICTELLVAYDRGVDESAYWVLAIAVLVSLATTELTAPAATRRRERDTT